MTLWPNAEMAGGGTGTGDSGHTVPRMAWGPAPPWGDPYLLVTHGQVNVPRVHCLPGDYRVSKLQP